MAESLFTDLQILSRGLYLQVPVEIRFLDDAVIRSNEAEEVLTQKYELLGERFIVPWRKTKGKLRRVILEKQRALDIEPGCHLKDNLCMQCPTCLLFGGTGEVSAAKTPYNLLSRVLGDTSISTSGVAGVARYTANAIDEKELTTGQALMTLLKVPVDTVFRGVVTLKDPTPEMAAILVDGLERLSRLGASTREWGRARTTVLGYVLGDRERLASYDIADAAPACAPMSALLLPTDVDAAYRKVDADFKALLRAEFGTDKKK